MTEKFQTVISWNDSFGSPNYMIFDAVDNIGHQKNVELTESPIDGGAQVADHAYLTPDTLTISGVVSNTPLPSNPGVGEASEFMGAAFMSPSNITFNIPKAPPIAPIFTPGGLTSAAVGAVEGLFGKKDQNTVAGVWKSTAGFEDRVLQAFERLTFMQSEFSRCTIDTKLATYENMILTSMIVPEDFASGDTRTFSLEFRQIITATTLSVQAPEPAEIRGTPPTQGSKQTKKGKSDENTEKVAEKAKNQSLLKSSLDWAVDKISP